MILCHDSRKAEYRQPFGAAAAGESVTLSLTARDCSTACRCMLVLCPDGGSPAHIPMEPAELPEKNGIRFTVSTIPSHDPGLFWYYFIATDGTSTLYYGNNPQGTGGLGQSYSRIPPAYQLTVYCPAPVPDWYKGSVVYQIFPDRFARSHDWMQRQTAADPGPDWKGPSRIILQNWKDTPFYRKNQQGEVTGWPFYGGTLAGIRSKLFYLKSMGAGAIYLNPVFTAFSNHKYDTADYMHIDPCFGTDEDFRLLAKDARRLGIRLILDGVFNHTGADSIYFNQLENFPGKGACQGPGSPYYNWYRFTDFPSEYQCWWGVKSLPDVNEEDPSYQEFIYKGRDSVVRHWLQEGASGWRLDVADELPDSFIAGIRRTIKETDPEGLLIGEVWEDASNKISYGIRRRYFLGEELDGAMNYPLRDLLLDYMLGRSTAREAADRLYCLAEHYPPENFYGSLNLIGSHDRIRILTILGDAPEGLSDAEKAAYHLPEEKMYLAVKRLKLLSLLQFILPGVPSVYYGDEAGVQGFEDPYNRGTYPWGQENQELLCHFRMLAGLRKQYDFLSHGDYSFSWQGEHGFICTRSSGSGEALVLVVNRHIFGNIQIELPLPPDTGYVLELLSAEEKMTQDGSLSLNLQPLCAQLFYCGTTPPAGVKLTRSAGVLCHVSSLPSGKLDKSAEDFIDFLAQSGQKLWQILPLNPADHLGNSPYSSPAVFAGNIHLCDLEMPVDSRDYEKFCENENYWLDDFALYTLLKEEFHGLAWQNWPEAERSRRNLDWWKKHRRTQLEQIKYQQYRFWIRWKEVKAYANEKGISIIGDVPVYAGIDSADTWAHQELFLLGEDGFPLAGAGVPPDYFNQEGQNWGNPLYDWDAMKDTDYLWWEKRISQAMEHYDYIRLDHFRSFSAFYAVPSGETAKNGYWLPGVGKNFFETLTEKLGPLPVLAEDLGSLDYQVYDLLKQTGYPGMLVYQFSSEEMKQLTPEQAKKKIFYTGTHDNQTLAGWCLEKNDTTIDTDDIIESLYKSSGAWVIIPVQDLLGLGDESRMNVPGQIEGNWSWRLESSQLTPELAARLRKWSCDSGR